MGLYAKDNQGRVATSWISDSKKKNKNNQQKTKKSSETTSFSKVLGLQDDYLRENEEWNVHHDFKQDYQKYLEEKSSDGCFHYKNLTSNDIDELVSMYHEKIHKKQEKLKDYRKKKEASRQMRKMISDTREEKVHEQQLLLMHVMTLEMKHRGLIRKRNAPPRHLEMSEDDTRSDHVDSNIVLGEGSYLRDMDMKWGGMYQKLHSGRNCHLFDIQSDVDWYRFLKNGGKHYAHGMDWNRMIQGVLSS